MEVSFAVRSAARFGPIVLVLLAPLTGCNQNGGLGAPGAQSAWNNQWEQQQQFAAQLQDLQRRAANLDANNRDLHAQLAQSQQQMRLVEDELNLTKRRLAETVDQLAQSRAAKQEADEKIEALYASMRRRAGATITANNSLRQQLSTVDIPGAQVRLDGDVVRIELPADQLFLTGSATLQQNAYLLLDRVATALQQYYPRQMIGIEGHTDNTPVLGGPGSSPHQLTAAQATIVFDLLTTRHRFNPSQLFVLGYGGSRPLVSNATTAGKARNRRIEIVVYPETLDGP